MEGGHLGFCSRHMAWETSAQKRLEGRCLYLAFGGNSGLPGRGNVSRMLEDEAQQQGSQDCRVRNWEQDGRHCLLPSRPVPNQEVAVSFIAACIGVWEHRTSGDS